MFTISSILTAPQPLFIGAFFPSLNMVDKYTPRAHKQRLIMSQCMQRRCAYADLAQVQIKEFRFNSAGARLEQSLPEHGLRCCTRAIA